MYQIAYFFLSASGNSLARVLLNVFKIKNEKYYHTLLLIDDLNPIQDPTFVGSQIPLSTLTKFDILNLLGKDHYGHAKV